MGKPIGEAVTTTNAVVYLIKSENKGESPNAVCHQ
jgi:hypothetical protein